MAKKPVVFVFYDHFHELLPTVFRVPGGFACLIRTDTCWRYMTQKLTVFAFYGYFHELLPTVLGFSGVLQQP